eukprot:12787159-Prorocentrum_lima.AAC.1
MSLSAHFKEQDQEYIARVAVEYNAFIEERTRQWMGHWLGSNAARCSNGCKCLGGELHQLGNE